MLPPKLHVSIVLSFKFYILSYLSFPLPPLLLSKKKKKHVSECFARMCATNMTGVHNGQKRELDLPGTKVIQIIVSCHLGAGNQTQV